MLELSKNEEQVRRNVDFYETLVFFPVIYRDIYRVAQKVSERHTSGNDKI